VSSTHPDDPTRKAHLWKTARAVISCARFRAGEFVSVAYYFTSERGVNWFLIHKTERGSIEPVAYPEHHLNEFCL